MTNFVEEIRGAVAIARPEGRLDAYTSPDLDAWLTESPNPTILLNLGGVTFMDTHVISLLVQTMKRTREQGGDLILTNLTKPVRIILELMRLDLAFTIQESEEVALGAIA